MRFALRRKVGPLAIGVALIASLLVAGLTMAVASPRSTAGRPAGNAVSTNNPGTAASSQDTRSSTSSEQSRSSAAAASQSTTEQSPSGAAAPWKHKTVKGHSCPGLLGCANWDVTISARVKYNGRNVYVDIPPTCLADSRGVDIPKTVGTLVVRARRGREGQEG
jgi:hypothetical protein